MRKHWIAMLSLLGIGASSSSANAQVIKGSQPNPGTTSDSTKKTISQGTKAATNEQKLQVKQQALRQQNKTTVNGGKQADTMTPSAYCKGKQQTTTAKANGQLTPPPPGQNNQITKGGNQQITKGNQQLTKGNQQVTKGGNQQITKGNNLQITKGNNQVTKGGNQQITKGNQQVTKGNNQQVTKAIPK
jgi:hypothetical protein